MFSNIFPYPILHFQQTALNIVEFEWSRDGFIIFHSDMQRLVIGFGPQWCTIFRFNGQPGIAGSLIILHLYSEWCFVHQNIKRHEGDLFCQRIVRQGIMNSNLRKRQIDESFLRTWKIEVNNITSYLRPSALHSTTPVDPAASSENLSLQSPFSTRSEARFLPKNTFSRYENRMGPS